MSDPKKSFDVVGGMSIVSTGQKIEQEKADFEKAAENVSVGEGTTLNDMYDQYSKLYYLIDESLSMGEGLTDDDSIKRFMWTPAILQQFRDLMAKEYQTELAEWQEEMDEVDKDDDELVEEMESSKPMDPAGVTDDELKRQILYQGLPGKYNIDIPINYNYRSAGRSKMMAVKDAAKKFVAERFKKFSDARVGVFKFTTDQVLLCEAGTPEATVLAAINRLADGGTGGTSIYPAIDRVLRECKRRPSEVNLHHIVLVSDGEDPSAMKVMNLLPRMKELGVVFDFIYIIGEGGDGSSKDLAALLREMCSSTGGEYLEVRTKEDLEKKLLAVSNRPMLPAPK